MKKINKDIIIGIVAMIIGVILYALLGFTIISDLVFFFGCASLVLGLYEYKKRLF